MQTPVTGGRAAPLLALLFAAPTPAAPLETVVVTGSRAAQPASELAASIRVVGSEELELVLAVHISEALARVPGAWISRGNGQEHLTAIRSPVFTGPGSCGAFYLAQDGLRLRPAGVCNVNELSEVDSEQAARIEVLRGPQGTLYGKNTTGGAINFITRRPDFENEGYVRLGTGNYGRIEAAGALQGALVQDRVAARLAFTYTKADGWFKGVNGTPDMDAVDQYGVRLGVLFRANDDLDFLLELAA